MAVDVADLSMKRVLMIAYYFPPIGGSGPIRALKFAKYLPQYGWEPYVLSVRSSQAEPYDAGLLKELPGTVSVVRTGHLDPAAVRRGLLLGWQILWRARLRRLADHLQPYKVMPWFMVPDDKIGWLLPAYRVGRKTIADHQISAVFTTSLPATTHLVGLMLKRATGLPWVADFRDEWTQNPFMTYPTQLHRRFNQYLEQQVLQEADSVVATTDPMTAGLASLVPHAQAGKFATLMNGYDEDDFAAVRMQPGPSDERFEIAYVGMLYGPRTARHLIAALSALIEEGVFDRSKVRLRIVGKAWTNELDTLAGVNWIELVSHVSHERALEIMHESHLLVLLVNPESGPAVPAKLFEYMATRRPVLALAPENAVAAQIIQKAGAGMVVPPENTEVIRSALLEFYLLHIQKQSWPLPSLETVRQYDRKQQTTKLAGLLDSLLASWRAG